MSSSASPCPKAEWVAVYVLRALPASEVPAVEAHLATCAECRGELQTLTPVVESFDAWPTDVLRPATSLWDRLSARIAPGGSFVPPVPTTASMPEWEEVAPGIQCKLLASDTARDRISMLVRLAPGASYPPHTHAGVEELHLLSGELWIEDRKLYPGDYNRSEPHTGDERVWSETGCTCVLITSTRDTLR